jgi:hypothetical protein
MQLGALGENDLATQEPRQMGKTHAPTWPHGQGVEVNMVCIVMLHRLLHRLHHDDC